ncbi:MAG: 2,3-bisphosphoglycerate-independent phosphoglycerate mutase, partial [Gemmatimonadota bacterium]|nr:2,3-bisphosphoglycerate-independent phosphoglycerate mutase [Gemmatimonadota bacterium]
RGPHRAFRHARNRRLMALRHKGVLVILDGLGDRPQDALGGRTPLEAADTPVMDRLAAAGVNGSLDPLGPGFPVDTATGTGLLLGAPRRSMEILSRGPVEAAGVGLDIAPDDIALRCNFATLDRRDGRLWVLDRRAGRIDGSTGELAGALEALDLGDGIVATVAPATQHRAVARLSGQGLSAAIGDTDPGAEELPAPLRRSKARQRDDLRATRTASAVNRFVEQAFSILSDHPVNRRRVANGEPAANGLITRAAGMAVTVRSVVEELGLAAAVVAGESTVIGLARLLAMNAIARPGFTGLPDTDLDGKMSVALASLDHHDLAFLHVKGADICSHDFDPEGKKAFLERVDAALAPLLELDLVVGVTGDHSTDATTGRHTGDPVPALLRAPGGRRDGLDEFGEISSARGALTRLTASDYLMSLLDAMGAVPEWRAGNGGVSHLPGGSRSRPPP